MSYRDMRNFTEMMRALGYKRLISLENFKKPLFPLMADIMTWLSLRFEPNADVPREIDSQQDRVIFIKYITEFMATKANVKVNPKKLYEADGYSVKEMIKVCQVLYQAMLSSNGQDEDDDDDGGDDDGISTMSVMSDLSSKAEELKEARQMASDLVTKGALLHDLLGREISLKTARLNALSKQLELNDVERTLNEYDRSMQMETAKIMSLIESVASDEANLEAKIEKKKGELERNRKRYESLQGVRPAYMDDFEICEVELQQIFDEYLDKQKNSAFLEQIYEKYKKVEQDISATLEIQLKKAMIHTQQDRPGINILEAARKRMFNGNANAVDNDDDDEDEDEDDEDDEEDDEEDDDDLIGRNNLGNNAMDPFSKRIKSSYHGRGQKSVPRKNNVMMPDEDDDDDDELKLSNADDDDVDDDLKLGDDDDDDDDDFNIGSNAGKGRGRGNKPMGARGVRGGVSATVKRESDDDDF